MDKFIAKYDSEEDVLSIYTKNAKVKESIEVAETLVIDIDKNRNLVNLELFDAYKFLSLSNKKITKKMLESIGEVKLDFKQIRNYWIIIIFFKYNEELITEKLPAFVSNDFKSPLVASVSA
jgi:uncharacterized protein YuzE|tara:strand:+ start:229 stop:591 length:363 start_codon:yes stop_codon:yes gene_type:complete